MNPGDVLHVSDLPHNSKLEFTSGEETAIAALHYSRTAQAVEEADAAVVEPTGSDAVTELRASGDVKSDSVTGV